MFAPLLQLSDAAAAVEWVMLGPGSDFPGCQDSVAMHLYQVFGD